MEGFPAHIQRIVTEIESGHSVERTLLKLAPDLNKEISLYNVLTQLDFNVETNRFETCPNAADALQLLSREYGVPINTNVDNYLNYSPAPKQPQDDEPLTASFRKTYDESEIYRFAATDAIGLEEGIPTTRPFVTPLIKDRRIISTPTPRGFAQRDTTRDTPRSAFSMGDTPYSETDGDLQDTPRNSRGLKYLTTLVKQSIHKSEPTSYTDVAVQLINELTCGSGCDRIKEEKNVRRRVYDAINVLIAAGVLKRDGKIVSWRKSPNYSKEELETRIQKIEEKSQTLQVKREKLKDKIHKYIALRNLLKKNKKKGDTDC